MTELARLTDRTVLHLDGTETVDFLQRIVTNDISQARADKAVYTALLTPQGKYLFDFFMVGDGATGYFLDIFADHREELAKRLTMYKLRADVTITDLSDSHAVFWSPDGASAPAGGIAFPDPRVVALGTRIVAPQEAVAATLAPDAYTAKRLDLGVPELPVDAERERTLSLEADLDLLNGVDFSKGCFVGQELTARMKYRGKVRKRLMPISIDGETPAPDTPVLTAEGKEAGKIRTAHKGQAIALLRLDDLAKGRLTVSGVEATPRQPDWWPAAEEA